MSVMGEFRHWGSHPRHVRDLLRTHRSFYLAINHNERTSVSHLNSTNSEVCVQCHELLMFRLPIHNYSVPQDLMSLFDDLLSDERQEEWNELQQVHGNINIEM